MKVRLLWVSGILVLALALMPALSFAAEHGGKEKMDSAAVASMPDSSAAATASPAAPTAPAPMPVPATPSTPPALKPIVITFSGDLSAVDAQATPAMITVQDRYGVKKEISVPAEAKISQGTSPKALTDLKTGDKLTVEYTYDVATGKRAAQSITIGEGAPSAQ
ncbi:MAG: hypothetical protein HY211_07265 [Candidatus Omnitrophica bacterium]|nr:hypothetical protein [Candidatus Omnitrophota bacterium]